MSVASSAIKIVPRILGIPRNVWIGLGVGLLLFIVAGMWAVFAGVSWLWGQAPGVVDAGTRAAGVAIEQAEKAAPGVREQVEVWLPGILGKESEGNAGKTNSGRDE